MDSYEPVPVELPTEAIPHWRDAAGEEQPALVLFSIHPFLQPVAGERKEEVLQLVGSGTSADFRRRGSFYRADPALVPTETVSVALAGGLFRELVWVFPSSVEPAQVSLETFRKQLVEAEFLSQKEAEALSLSQGVFNGTVRGIPFRAAHPQALPEIDGDFVLHLDLGYFRGLYQGEVKTPVYDVLHATCRALKEAAWDPRLITLSYSTVEGTISHDVRFLLSNLAEILRDPRILEQMPARWARRGEALYSVNFFLEDKVREMYRQNAAEHPHDAAAQYDYYRSLFEDRNVDEALQQLEKAVAFDAGYAAVYLELAQIAETDRNLKVAVDLLGKGRGHFPDNPFIDLYRAQFLLQLGQTEKARPLIRQLQDLPWSSHYHPQIPEMLTQMGEASWQEMKAKNR